jgi:peptidoglycan/LPS O-acetylase OafA/YrhL
MLHTWSLSVEEQFYIFFPLLLLALRGGSHRALRISIFADMAASIAAAEWSSVNALSADFYLLPTRIWELMAGALVAITVARRTIVANDPLAILGLLMIVVAVFFFDSATTSPSFWTLLPVVGTILVIAFGAKGTLLATALSFPPMVAIGLISYSVYLWHQPILAFYRIRAIENPQGYQLFLLFVATFTLATLTWKFVEQPLRKGGGAFVFTLLGFPRERHIDVPCCCCRSFLYIGGVACRPGLHRMERPSHRLIRRTICWRLIMG